MDFYRNYNFALFQKIGIFSGLTSGTFNNNQINYNINEKKLLAIKKGINKFEIFLLPKHFIIETDNTQVEGFIKKITQEKEYKLEGCLDGKLFLVIIILKLYI